MNVWKLLSALVVSISTSTLAQAQNLDDLDLTKGILALHCSDADSVDTPLVFVRGDAGWVLNGSEDVVVTEIDDGFRLTGTTDLNWMAFVKEEQSGAWLFRIFSERDANEAKCKDTHMLVEIVTDIIAPRITDNFSKVAKEAVDSIPRLKAELQKKAFSIAQLEQRYSDLVSSNKKLVTQIEQLKADFNENFPGPIQRKALQIRAFKAEYGYDMSDKARSDFKFEESSQQLRYCLVDFESESPELTGFCTLALKKALLPNPD